MRDSSRQGGSRQEGHPGPRNWGPGQEWQGGSLGEAGTGWHRGRGGGTPRPEGSGRLRAECHSFSGKFGRESIISAQKMKKKGQEGAIITSREKEKLSEKRNLDILRETSPHSAVGRLPGVTGEQTFAAD